MFGVMTIDVTAIHEAAHAVAGLTEQDGVQRWSEQRRHRAGARPTSS
jgi:hypothetical protein